jgi:hypothetical protein
VCEVCLAGGGCLHHKRLMNGAENSLMDVTVVNRLFFPVVKDIVQGDRSERYRESPTSSARKLTPQEESL